MIRPLRGLTALASLCALIIMSGCGFQPLYGSASFSGLPGLTIETGSTRQDYLVEDSLRDFLGGGRSAYTLTLQTDTDERVLGLSAAGRATRFSYGISTRYVLRSREGTVLSGTVQETLYLDAPRDPYALIAARADVEERAADQIARLLARDLAAGLERQRREGGAQP